MPLALYQPCADPDPAIASSYRRGLATTDDWRSERRRGVPMFRGPRPHLLARSSESGGLQATCLHYHRAWPYPPVPEMVQTAGLGPERFSVVIQIREVRSVPLTHCASRPSWDTVTTSLSEKLVVVTSVGTLFTRPVAVLDGAGKASLRTPLSAMINGDQDFSRSDELRALSNYG